MSKEPNRPVLDLPMSSAEKLAETAAAMGLVFFSGTLISYWPELPNEIPIHFGLSGEPDAFGSKTKLLILPIVTLLVYAGLTVLRRFTRAYNYPSEITVDNAPRQYSLARTLIAWLKAEVIWLFAYVCWKTCRVAIGEEAGLGGWFLPVILVVLAFTVTAYIVKAVKSAR